MRRPVFALIALAAMIVASACLKSESTVTWYVDPGGAVTWSILERDIRSDAKDRTERETEESTFLTLAKSREHPAGTGFLRVGGAAIKSTIIKDKPPFVVLTEAQFTGLDQLGRRLMNGYRITGTSFVTRDGDAWTWTLTIEDTPEEMDDELASAELEALIGDRLQVALREGHFTKAKGFEIQDDGRIARMVKDLFDTEPKKNGPIVLELTWVID